MSELTPEQLKALRAEATKRVNRKMKSTVEKEKRERKWAEEQITESSVISKPKDSDKVPVKLDARTTIMVRRDKCIQLKDGTWIKKEDSTKTDDKQDKPKRANARK